MLQPRGVPWRFAAAAVLLIAAGLWVIRPSPPVIVPPTPSAPEAFPRAIAAVEVLSPKAFACAKQGTRARALSEDRIELVEGTLFVKAASVRVSTPFGECEAHDAAFQIRCSRPGAISLIPREAWAGTPEGEVLVECGAVSLGGVAVPPGCRLRPGGRPEPLASGVLAASLVWRDGDAAWRDLLPGGLARRAMAWPERFIWEAWLRVSPGAYLEVVLPGGEAMTLGALQGLSDGKEHLVALRWDPLPCLRVDGHEVKTFQAQPLQGGHAGLCAVGGSLDVLSWRWRPLP